jgi:hypothetical protein
LPELELFGADLSHLSAGLFPLAQSSLGAFCCAGGRLETLVYCSFKCLVPAYKHQALRLTASVLAVTKTTPAITQRFEGKDRLAAGF